jgi:hypothetical protein
MSRLKLKCPSAGTVLGTLALIVALAGTADAVTNHTIVRKGDIAKGAVTANSLAPGAVHSKALAKGAVSAAALRKGAVNQTALAPDAVTAGSIAPGSVYGGSLGAVTVHSAPIVDKDATEDLSNWTASGTAVALCSPGERVLSGGVVFTNSGNRRVGILQSVPFENAEATGWAGQITSDSGGTAVAEVQAFCLK